MVKLQVQATKPTINFCDDINITKELKGDNEVMMTQVMLIQEVTTKHNIISDELKGVLQQYSDVFKEPKGLPPSRSSDQQIVLKPHTIPVNQRPYRYSYYQKMELDKIIEELIKKTQ
jgi:hypothetical protein